MDYYTKEMVAGDFDKYFSIKRYLGGGAFGKVFTAEQRGHSKQVSQNFFTTGAFATNNKSEISVFYPICISPFTNLKCFSVMTL